ncbi:hypothetical protein Poly21_26920 [Allorhodopirellula heiligendammensis]|uniref:Uncharacterized protein n=1 Tax=Allorhodopirellula heiligendammensis TaxID=2714739 RepID=A0A5C6BU08_9BACT|nr:hypothetical protein Poly21_26920 [Allorhodopirellula heiligendammensis]
MASSKSAHLSLAMDGSLGTIKIPTYGQVRSGRFRIGKHSYMLRYHSWESPLILLEIGRRLSVELLFHLFVGVNVGLVDALGNGGWP